MGLRSQFKTDAKVEVEGVWLDYDSGVKIRTARAGGANKRYLKAMERLSRKYKRQLNLEILPFEVQNRLLREVYAETVILGWEGVTNEDLGSDDEETMNDEVLFSRDNCLRLFEELPELFKDVQESSSTLAIWRADLRTTESKN